MKIFQKILWLWKHVKVKIIETKSPFLKLRFLQYFKIMYLRNQKKAPQNSKFVLLRDVASTLYVKKRMIDAI